MAAANQDDAHPNLALNTNVHLCAPSLGVDITVQDATLQSISCDRLLEFFEFSLLKMVFRAASTLIRIVRYFD